MEWLGYILSGKLTLRKDTENETIKSMAVPTYSYSLLIFDGSTLSVDCVGY